MARLTSFVSACTGWVLLLSLGLNRPAQAQTDRFSYGQLVDHGDTLRYRMLFPDYDTLRHYPLVVFLHGSGERGSDNQAQLKWGVQEFASDAMMTLHPALVIAPQCPAGESWSHMSGFGTGQLHLEPGASRPMQLVIALIHKLEATLPVDTNRIYITGLSMGGLGTYDAIERYPDLFAAALPVAGGGDPSLAGRIVHVPLWDVHGSEDAAVNPLYSLTMIEALTQAGGHPGFSLIPETGHFSWLAAYSDPRIMEWLFRQRKP